jgi:hypothetical protein
MSTAVGDTRMASTLVPVSTNVFVLHEARARPQEELPASVAVGAELIPGPAFLCSLETAKKSDPGPHD